MTTKLEQAARQALVALEDVMADFDGSWALADTAITALRKALSEQEKPLYRKVLREMLDAQEQAEQEPMYISKGCVERGCACHYSVEVDGEPVAVYSAPVRTKDLTDDELDIFVSEKTMDMRMTLREFARAVIAADREKNK